MKHGSLGTGVRLSFMAAALAMLASCGAARLDELQDDYRRAFLGLATAEVQQQRTGDPATGAGRPYQFELAEVARQAADEGGKAREPRTAIAFYLIGALAGWQAGPEGQPILLDVVDRGARACDQLRDSPSRPARDCAQIVLVPSLAINDRLYADIGQLKAQAKAPGATRESLLPAAQRLLADTRENFGRLARNAPAAGSASISPSYLRYYETQKLVLYCNHLAVASLIADRPIGDPAAFKEATALREQLSPDLRSRQCQQLPGRS